MKPSENPNYRGLPVELAAELPNVDWNNLEPTQESRFTVALEMFKSLNQAWDDTMRQQTGRRNPYHDAGHMSVVAVRVCKVAQFMRLPLAKAQSLCLAGTGHDAGHPGVGIRQSVINGCPLIYPDLVGITNERASAIATDDISRIIGVSLGVRILTFGAIESSLTGIDDPGGHNDVEDILRACDVLVSDCTPSEWIRESAKVTKETSESDRKPLGDWIRGRRWFLKNIVRPRMELVPATMQLWGEQLRAVEDYMDKAVAGDSTIVAYIDDIVGHLLPS